MLNNNLGDYTAMQPAVFSNTNADNITTTFGMGFNITNAPSTANAFIFISIPYDDKTIELSDFACQIAMPVQYTNELPKYRQKSNKVWTAWKDF